MTNNYTSIEEWEKIQQRKEVFGMLLGAIDGFEKGNRSSLKSMLERIHNEYQKGFTVHKGLDEGTVAYLAGQRHTDTDKVIVIKHDSERTFIIYKCRIKNKLFISYNEYDMLTATEKKFISQFSNWMVTDSEPVAKESREAVEA